MNDNNQRRRLKISPLHPEQTIDGANPALPHTFFCIEFTVFVSFRIKEKEKKGTKIPSLEMDSIRIYG